MGGMTNANETVPEVAPVDVALSGELLREIDEFAAHHGYENPDAVVAAALARQAEE